MKKLLVGMIVLVLFAIAGVVIFLVTFDLDRYRPEIEKKIEEATGSRAQLGKLSLGLQDGLSLSVNGLALTEPGSASPDLAAKLFRATVRLEPLLQKRVELGKIQLAGLRAHATRGADGVIRVKGYAPPTSESRPSGEASASPASPVSFSVSSIVVEDAELRFTDQTPSFPMDLDIRNVDIRLRDVSLTGPIQFEAAASVLSDKQNLKARGRVTLPPSPGAAVLIEGFGLRTDLAALDLERLPREIPKSVEWGLRPGLAGVLTVEAPRLEAAPGTVPRAEVKLTLEDGAFSHAALKEKVQEIQLDAEYKGERLEIERADMTVAGSKISASGSAGLSPGAQHRFRLSVERFDLGRSLKPSKPGAVFVNGQVSLKFDGTASGLVQHELLETLNGQGELLGENVVIYNFNLLWEVFSKFSSAVPGLLEGLQKQLPEAMRQRMMDAKTEFAPIRAAFTVRDRSVFFDGLQLATQDLAIAASGRAGFDAAIDAQTVLFVHPDFSKAAVSSAQNLQYLQDAQGQLKVGAEIQRTAQGQISIKPDLSPILSRAVADQGQRLLSGLLEKKGTGDAATGAEAGSGGSSGDALTKLLSKI